MKRSTIFTLAVVACTLSLTACESNDDNYDVGSDPALETTGGAGAQGTGGTMGSGAGMGAGTSTSPGMGTTGTTTTPGMGTTGTTTPGATTGTGMPADSTRPATTP
jgi:hypothetical protein